MVKHIVFFKYKPEASAADRQRLADELLALPAQVPQIKGWEVRTSVPGRPARFYDIALFGDFEDVPGIDAYIACLPHQRLLETINAVCDARAPFNYEF